MPPSVFLSHSSADKNFARKIASGLQNSNIKIWIDEAELKIGDSLLDSIGDAIYKMDLFCIILSEHSVNSEWVQRELKIALLREFSEQSTSVLPILIQRVDIPIFLRDKLYADFTSTEKFDSSLAKLVWSIHSKFDSSYAQESFELSPKLLLRNDVFYKDISTVVFSVFNNRKTHYSPSLPTQLLDMAKSRCKITNTSEVISIINQSERYLLFFKENSAIVLSHQGLHIVIGKFSISSEYPGQYMFIKYENINSTILSQERYALDSGRYKIIKYRLHINNVCFSFPDSRYENINKIESLFKMIGLAVDKHSVSR